MHCELWLHARVIIALIADIWPGMIEHAIGESKPEILVLIPCGYYKEDILRQLPNTS